MLVPGVLFAVILTSAVAIWLATWRRSRRTRHWLASTRPARSRVLPPHTYVYWQPDWAGAEASFSRHPAGRSRKTPADGCVRPKGPDDDPEYIRALERRIRGTRGENND